MPALSELFNYQCAVRRHHFDSNPSPPPAAWPDRGCSLHSGWWCGRLKLYWQLPMSIQHYGMKQCFTQYLNLILRVSPRPGRPGKLQGRPKSAETKWIRWTVYPPPSSSSISRVKEEEEEEEDEVTGEDVTMEMTGKAWQTSAASERTLQCWPCSAGSASIQCKSTLPPTPHCRFFLHAKHFNQHHADTRLNKKHNSTMRARSPLCHT